MRRYIFLGLLVAGLTVHATSTLRVGSRVLSAGDTAARVRELLGEPLIRSYLHRQDGGLPSNQISVAEQWQYGFEGKTVIVTIVNGRAADFEERPD